MKEISLTKGQVTLVDDGDYEALMQWKWCATPARPHGSYYAVRKGRVGSDEPRFVAMHRFIMGIPTGIEVDHINHDTLDNRRANLRLASRSQNAQNTRKLLTSATSRYKGVTFDLESRKWQAVIKRDGEMYYLGLFQSEEQAAAVYNEAARLLFGEFACLNEIQDWPSRRK